LKFWGGFDNLWVQGGLRMLSRRVYGMEKLGLLSSFGGEKGRKMTRKTILNLSFVVLLI
jgi:hypothetical protein